jgi:hypothetical protein
MTNGETYYYKCEDDIHFKNKTIDEVQARVKQYFNIV